MNAPFLVNTTRLVDGKPIKKGWVTDDYMSDEYALDARVIVTAPGGKKVAYKEAGEAQLTIV